MSKITKRFSNHKTFIVKEQKTLCVWVHKNDLQTQVLTLIYPPV